MKPNDAVPDAAGVLVCPECKKPVSNEYQAGDFIVRRHKERRDDGTLCEHGHGEGDPVPVATNP